MKGSRFTEEQIIRILKEKESGAKTADIARCTVERLMKEMGLQGVIRGKPVRTTLSNKAAPCPLDHVNRQFHAPAPDML